MTSLLRHTWCALLAASLLAACSIEPVEQVVPGDGGDDGPVGGSGGRGGSGPPPSNNVDGGSNPGCAVAPLLKKPAGQACACDNECATSACVLGLCCGGEDCAKLPEGAPCTSSSMCSSAFCADGLCCNTACSGGCVSCNQPGKGGECHPVASGERDPHDRCRNDPPDTCGENGLCNGQGGCTKHEAGTICRAGGCADGRTLMAANACDGNGQCLVGQGIDCAPWTCNAGICRLTCENDTQCTAPAHCRAEDGCGKYPLGSKCSKAADCGSGFCVDGVCCESGCTDKCAYCAFPNSPGRCVAVPANATDPRASAGVRDAAKVCLDQGAESCGNNGRCDGNRGCQRYPNGTVCQDADCDSGSNSDTDVGTCKSGACAVPKAQSCAPFQGCQGKRCATFCASDGNCVNGNVCLKGSCGKRPMGAACSRGDECASPGVCAQGRCCASQCNGTCQSCSLPGSLGTCTPVPEGGADPTGACKDDACSNGCDGSGKCRREPTGNTCKAASCNGNTLVTFACNAQGVCQMASRACDSGQTCMTNRCMIVAQDPGGACVAGGDCKSGACVNGRCCESACSGGCKQCTAATQWKCVAISCPGGTTCNPKTNGCDPIERGPGESCGGNNGTCRSGLSCLGGICCMAASCSGNVCLNGRCKADGSGCEPVAAGRDCGTTCSSATTLITKSCNGGTCVTNTTTCSNTQVCNKDHCEMKPPPDKGPGESCNTGAECRMGLSCIRNVCCSAGACMGPCLTGACRADGSGCQPRMVGIECNGGPTCNGMSLVTRACNDAGTCATTTTACPMGQVCNNNRCMDGPMMPPPKGMAGDDCDQTSDCANGLTCVSNICCMASSCQGPCLTGSCRNNGSGCQPRQDGFDCGSACSGSAALSSKKCNATGTCVTSVVMCSPGQACSDARCASAPGAGPGQSCGGDVMCQGNLMCLGGRCCRSACDEVCQAGTCNAQGMCEPAADGTSCGNGKRVCMGGRCVKQNGPGGT